jgi:hypothetical protein
MITAYVGDGPAGRQVGRTLDRALGMVVADMAEHRATIVSLRREVTPEAIGTESVLLVATSGSTLMIIGRSHIAGQIRSVLADPAAVPPFDLHSLPDHQSPLRTLGTALPTRIHHRLASAGFTAVEEVAAVPTEAWPTMHGFGIISAERIRSALAGEEDLDERADAGFPYRRATLAGLLGPVHLVRHTVLVDRLAASRLPISAAIVVCTRAALEPLPPADPKVLQLLSGSNADTELLAYYRDTHSDLKEDDLGGVPTPTGDTHT